MGNKISKLFIFLIAISLGMVKAYGAEVGQSVETDVQPAVAVEKLPSTETATVTDPVNGIHTGLESKFSLETNDDNYNFVVTSTIVVNGVECSAYGHGGSSVLFAHTLASPTLAAVEDAKIGGRNNKNVIAYPVNVNVSATGCDMLVGFDNSDPVYGDCYLINVKGIGKGTLSYKVSETPVSGTYNVGKDQYGSYQSVVTVTAINK